MDIGRPRRIVEVEPVSAPLPDLVPDLQPDPLPDTEPIPEPEPIPDAEPVHEPGPAP